MPPSHHSRYTLPLPIGTLAGLIIAILAVLIVAIVSYRSLQSRTEAFNLVTHTLEVIQQLEVIGSTVKDVETGQRGYLLTSEERHFDIYNVARTSLPGMLAHLSELVADNPEQATEAASLKQLVDTRVEVAEQTLVLKRMGDDPGALSLLRSGRGVAAMAGIRSGVATMSATERRLLEARETSWNRAARASTVIAWLGSASLLVLIGLGAVLLSRDFRSRESLAWMQRGQAELGAKIQGEQRIETLGAEVINFLARYLDAPVGAVYIADSTGAFQRVAGYAVAGDVNRGDAAAGGLIDQAARENRTLRITSVPADYLPISSALGRRSAIELLIAPATVDGEVQAVIELGFFRRISPVDIELMTSVSEMLAIAARSSKDRSRLEELLAETQQQAEELQTQQEELRVNNEELEEQSRILKESQGRLEQQQAELEQINAHLEEQTHLLEAQKSNLAQTQVVLTDKATELERANHYKSEFLANMSHELRTPLNSSLILATLLADNRDGNLTEEQVQFARTIYEAGNDLLALINDILDLSKIESGKVELIVEPVALSTTIDSLDKTFEPIAAEKGLAFSSVIDPGLPASITSDAQRLGQVLKNLLSNAIKFTERGAVSLRVSPGPGDTIRFAVQDSGIGIHHGQQEIIFEAFRQADGSTHRKYGGTGLGLSISRDLARLLGGDIGISSEPGRGSIFTLTLPATYAGPSLPGALPAPAPQTPAMPAIERRAEPRTTATVLSPPQIEDDRDQLAGSTRRILIVEDDVAFAGILRDLAREKGFRTIVTHTAGDGIIAANTLAPSAIVLDVNLPDHSGLGVLDQLKRTPKTRHIPVHVVSVADYAHQAMERGAVGYALKPITREHLSEALGKLEAKLLQGVRRVLVVEDDARQRASIAQLLGSPDVEITGVSTAREALDALAATTFDCVVMDLKLPDVNGIELLEQMAANDRASFPPVIVYTGRSLTTVEEQRLRRFSRSIIIKDARSPERLLDEVTLFLHQVESTLPLDRQQMLQAARNRDTALEQRRILVVEDDVRNIFALTRVLEPRGASVEIARNGKEALTALERAGAPGGTPIDLVLMDIMMPEMDGITAMQEIRKRPEWRRLPIIALTAKAMKDDQEKCLAAGANDYMAKPFDVEKLLSLVRVWMPK